MFAKVAMSRFKRRVSERFLLRYFHADLIGTVRAHDRKTSCMIIAGV